jgi:hypothetical protein
MRFEHRFVVSQVRQHFFQSSTGGLGGWIGFVGFRDDTPVSGRGSTPGILDPRITGSLGHCWAVAHEASCRIWKAHIPARRQARRTQRGPVQPAYLKAMISSVAPSAKPLNIQRPLSCVGPLRIRTPASSRAPKKNRGRRNDAHVIEVWGEATQIERYASPAPVALRVSDDPLEQYLQSA